MRTLTEPTCRNLLRPPRVLGVPFLPLVILAIGVVGVQTLGRGSPVGNGLALALAVAGYATLRALARFARPGWEEGLLYAIERRVAGRTGDLGEYGKRASAFPVLSPDTLDERGLILAKAPVEEAIRRLRPRETLTLLCEVGDRGAKLSEIRLRSSGKGAVHPGLGEVVCGIPFTEARVYSLYRLPAATDPLFLVSQLQEFPGEFRVLVSIHGVDAFSVKARIEASRKLNARSLGLSSVDSDVTFDEASRVLEGLSRGEECVVEVSLCVVAREALSLDPTLFVQEKNPALTVLSTLGVRPRFHRSHLVRAVTASDLVPNLLDPEEDGTAVLRTLRGKPLYFNPMDPKLGAPHWLVSGGTGAGKSFFVALFLRRMIRSGVPISVLFLDHNRSFRRVVKQERGLYLEPRGIDELREGLDSLFFRLDEPGVLCGVELSELLDQDKQEATRLIFRRADEFLRKRRSRHALRVTLDEAWDIYLTEVARAFREWKKLRGGMIAISQSLEDFEKNWGRSVFQNTPVRILLRQEEDLAPYRGLLGIQEKELALLRSLRQEPGVFSECLIKTRLYSKLGRLYPTPEEHELFRTDNVQEEGVSQASAERQEVTCGQQEVPSV